MALLGTDRKEEAVGGPPKLPQLDGLLGVAAASTAIILASAEPPAWLIDRYANFYFAVVSGIFFAGVTLVTASVRATEVGRHHYASGRKLALINAVAVCMAMLASSLLQGDAQP